MVLHRPAAVSRSLHEEVRPVTTWAEEAVVEDDATSVALSAVAEWSAGDGRNPEMKSSTEVTGGHYAVLRCRYDMVCKREICFRKQRQYVYIIGTYLIYAF